MAKKSNKSGIKKKYKVTNWSEYNKALENRGSITFWFSDEYQSKWYETDKNKNKVGSPFVYSDLAIEICISIGTVFHLRQRQLVGFLRSLIEGQSLDLKIPSYSVYSKRRGQLKVKNKFRKIEKNQRVNILVDSTGLKIYGEGEWKILKHGLGKRKLWRKLHLSVDDESRQIISSELTTCKESDSSQIDLLLKESFGSMDSFTGDGAYDDKSIYKLLEEQSPSSAIIIPPKEGSRIKHKFQNMKGRDYQVLIKNSLGRAEWEKATAYKRQNIVENAMFRYKTIIGNKMNSRSLKGQVVESEISVNIINKMTQLGMPKTIEII